MMLKDRYDVVIVGGGPGGSSAAKNLALKGFKVAMLEKRQEIGAPKRCGEGLTFATLELIGEVPKNCVAQVINGANIYAPNMEHVRVDFGEAGGYVLERKVFDKWLAFEASRAGAYVQANTEVLDVIKEGSYVRGVVVNENGKPRKIHSKVVVAADGVESTIARKAGLDTVNQLVNVDSGYQYEMSNLKIKEPDKIHLFFGNEMAPRGYVWIFPKGEDIANVGIGTAMTEKPAREYLDMFIEAHPEIFKGAGIIEVNAGGIPVGGLLENMVANGLVVVGDAAHQVNPIHGGGMKEGTIAGRIAANVIERCLKEGDVSEENLSEYNRIWWEERGGKLQNVEKLRHFMEKLSDKDMNMLAEVVDGDLMVELTRGNKLTTLAKLLMKKPGLLKLARHLI
jgi:digeranylgeranylglycerophospholipid reductase